MNCEHNFVISDDDHDTLLEVANQLLNLEDGPDGDPRGYCPVCGKPAGEHAITCVILELQARLRGIYYNAGVVA